MIKPRKKPGECRNYTIASRVKLQFRLDTERAASAREMSISEYVEFCVTKQMEKDFKNG